MKFLFRKTSFENCYSEDPRFKKRKIDIGHFEQIKVESNPKYWSPEDVNNYLSHDPFCKDIREALISSVIITNNKLLNLF